MARGCSDSDSEEERHDRFKSERNPSSSIKPSFRSLPRSLDDYGISRSRSPLRSNSSRSDRHRSTNDISSVSRRERSRDRKRSRERKLSKERDDYNGSSDDKKLKSRSSHDKKSVSEKDRYESGSRKRSREKDEITDKTYKEKDQRSRDRDKKRSRESERNSDDLRNWDSKDEVKSSKISRLERDWSSSDSNDVISENGDDEIVFNEVKPTPLPRYYELVESIDVSETLSHSKTSIDEKASKKHKKSKDKTQSHENKKRKKDKKHKRKHQKRKDEDGNVVEEQNISPLPKIPVSKFENEGVENTEINTSNNKENVETNSLSPEKSESEHEEGEISGSESELYFGPALPPGKVNEKKCYGPSLPKDEDHYGPALPPSAEPMEEEKEGSEDIIGPLPAGQESCMQTALDIRASLLRKQMDNKIETDVARREEWMTELPEVRRAQLGLGPRKFRSNAAPDLTDRTSWTDTPKDKARKKLMGEEEEELDTKKLEVAERNKEMELLSKKSEKKEKSLLAMHQKEIRRKKKKEKERGDEGPERRPFSREVDLQSNKFDEAQKRSIIKKAQLLDSRFSVGESKYL